MANDGHTSVTRGVHPPTKSRRRFGQVPSLGVPENFDGLPPDAEITVREGDSAWRPRLSRRLGADHPARGGEPNLGSVHKGIKGGTDGLDDLGAGPLVLALKCQTDRTQPRDEADQLRLGQGALDVDRLEVDVGPATRVEDRSDPLRVGEGELSRAVCRAV